MSRKTQSITGNAITQYGIIIILIALALIPVFFVTGKYIMNSFDSYYQTLKKNNTSTTITDNDVINGSVKAGQLGGTGEKPAFKCAGEVCVIDYGDFVLNGIPADFNGLVQSSGTSGGTDRLLSLLESLVKQMESNPNKFTTDEVAKIKGLIARGKDIVNIEKTLETEFAKQLPLINEALENRDSGLSDLRKAYTAFKTSNASSCSIESNCKELFSKESSAKTLFHKVTLYNQQLETISTKFRFAGLSRYTTADNREVELTVSNMVHLLNPEKVLSYINIPEATPFLTSDSALPSPLHSKPSYEQYLSGTTSLPALSENQQRSLVGEYINELKTLNDDPSYNSVLKSITKTLSQEIFDLSQNLQDKASKVNYNLFYTQDWLSSSIIEALKTSSTSSSYGGSLNSSLKSKPSERSRLDLSLICNSHNGEFETDNISCKKQK